MISEEQTMTNSIKFCFSRSMTGN
ncbi:MULTISPECIES: peptide IlvX [Klebsiella/Raoultella group]|nr:peptide IlvX [Raoultella ornithinolytica]MCS7493405.1 peptide IlvX [Raoultella planticola]MCT8171743.1 peptide IlvX [Raoultella ornithinolytica]MDC3911174.1 peptide IlvX [Raoultella planticola]QWU12930.1 peptide IlvX [Raoultella ornithinolytica]